LKIAFLHGVYVFPLYPVQRLCFTKSLKFPEKGRLSQAKAKIDMIDFGKRIELMVDRFLIESTDRCTFAPVTPECIGKAIDFDKAWERPGSLGVTAFDDNGTVKLYYRGFPIHNSSGDANEKQTACLAVSEDGVNFTRYPVNEIEYDGIKENNIVEIGSHCHNFAAFLDKNPDAKQDEKYKAICGKLKMGGGLAAYGSPDGIHWHLLSDKPVITDGTFDTMNIAFYDTNAKKYRCYSRHWSEGVYKGYRIIQSCESDDFLHWTAPKPNVYPEHNIPCEELYTNAAGLIPGAEHILISMPMRFHRSRKKFDDYAGNPSGSVGVSDMVLMTSRDGVNWDRTVRGAWVSGGLYSHEWTQRCFIVSAGIIERGEDFLFYVEKNYMWDEDDGIYVYRVPRYRFISLSADCDGGSFVTKPLKFETDEIYLNYSTSGYGYVKVIATDENGAVIAESDEIYGNELSHRLHFDGIAGKCGRLRFELNDAKIYAVGSRMN